MQAFAPNTPLPAFHGASASASGGSSAASAPPRHPPTSATRKQVSNEGLNPIHTSHCHVDVFLRLRLGSASWKPFVAWRSATKISTRIGPNRRAKATPIPPSRGRPTELSPAREEWRPLDRRSGGTRKLSRTTTTS